MAAAPKGVNVSLTPSRSLQRIEKGLGVERWACLMAKRGQRGVGQMGLYYTELDWIMLSRIGITHESAMNSRAKVLLTVNGPRLSFLIVYHFPLSVSLLFPLDVHRL